MGRSLLLPLLHDDLLGEGAVEADEVAEVLELRLFVDELDGLEPEPPALVAISANPTESLEKLPRVCERFGNDEIDAQLGCSVIDGAHELLLCGQQDWVRVNMNMRMRDRINGSPN